MNTFFNLKIKETNDLMRKEIKEIVVPFLKDQGWAGDKTRFRRTRHNECQTLDIQFNKWGRSFAVNLGIVEKTDNFEIEKYDSLITIRSQRLGSRQKTLKRKRNMDHWFMFLKGVLIYFPSYKGAARELILKYNSEAEDIFKDMRESINKNVYCIHLERV